MALEPQRENEGMKRSGPPDPLDFRVESVQLKCILPELSSSISTEPPLFLSKLLLPIAHTRQRNRLSSWNWNAGSWPSDSTRNTTLFTHVAPI